MRIKVDVPDQATLVVALSYEISEVLECHLTLAADLEGFLSTRAKLLYRTGQTDAEIVSRETENLANGTRDTCAICMDVVDCC